MRKSNFFVFWVFFMNLFSSLAIAKGGGGGGGPVPVTFTVNSTLDEVDSNIGNSVCLSVNGNCTLRAAIQEANAHNVAGDTIILPAETYTLTISGSETLSAQGDLNILSSGLNINGAGASTTIIDGGALDNVFHVQNAAALNLSGLTLQNGMIGVYCQGSSVGVFESVVKDNSDTGILMQTGSLGLLESTVKDNGKAGVYLSNTATQGIITGSTISGNQDSSGGGIYTRANLILFYVTISGNHAFTGGGGIYAESPANVSIDHSTIANNTSVMGSGILNNNASSFLLFHTLIDDNNCAGAALTTGFYNLDSGHTCVTSLSGGDLNDIDPLLGPLQDNGGMTDTHALMLGSPAINAGAPSNSCFPVYDQRHADAPMDGFCDIGAYEYHKFQVGLDSATQSVSESAGTVTITVHRTAIAGNFGPSSVHYSTSNGTALSGQDYTSTSGTLTWASGDYSDQTFQVPVTDNALDESDKTFTVNLSSLSNCEAGTYTSETVTISDDELTPDPPPSSGGDDDSGDSGGGDSGANDTTEPLGSDKASITLDPENKEVNLVVVNQLDESIIIDSISVGDLRIELDGCSGVTLQNLGDTCLLSLKNTISYDRSESILVTYTRLVGGQSGTLTVPFQISGYSDWRVGGGGPMCSLNNFSASSDLSSVIVFLTLAGILSSLRIRQRKFQKI